MSIRLHRILMAQTSSLTFLHCSCEANESLGPGGPHAQPNVVPHVIQDFVSRHSNQVTQIRNFEVLFIALVFDI